MEPRIDDIELLSNEELYNRYAPAVYGNIYRITPQVPIAAKILEKVFAEAFRNRVELHNSLRSPLTTLLNRSRNKTAQTLLALHILNECCAGSTVKRKSDEESLEL